MNVREIFYSIQGEGKYIGTPVIFLRTAGCSAHCPFCDSKETWQFPEDDGAKYSFIIKDIQRASSRCKTVVITGGEPTEQRDLYTITEQLKFDGYRVHLETNGANDVSRGFFEHVVCSPKPAFNYRVSKGADELKYVISARMDESQILRMIPAEVRAQFAGRIWLQPMDEGEDSITKNIKYCNDLALRDPRLRVGIQLHKYIGVQ